MMDEVAVFYKSLDMDFFVDCRPPKLVWQMPRAQKSIIQIVFFLLKPMELSSSS